ncbi:MAG: head-tail connector protein [Ruminococcus sp.]|nr:head-tail connector protein [Ruminococcus sp.]
MISLNEAKNYLRVDHCEDNRLISELIETSKKLVMDVGRMNEDEFTKNEEPTQQTMLYTIA